MATFRVNQRVRVVSFLPGFVPPHERHLLGKEGVITAYCADYKNTRGESLPWEVQIDGDKWPCGFASCQLVPAVDPAADAFLSRIKNLKPYEEPVAPKSKVRA